MNSSKLETIERVLEFLSITEVMEVSVESTEGCYAFIQATLDKFGYGRLGKADKGLIRRHLRKMTGYSRAQLTRLIADHRRQRPLA